MTQTTHSIPKPGDRVRVTFADGSEPVESTVRQPGSDEYFYYGPFEGWEAVDNGRATVEVVKPPKRRPRR